MHAYRRTHFFPFFVALWTLGMAQLGLAQAPGGQADSEWLTPTAVGTLAAVGVAWLAWSRRIDVARIVKNISDSMQGTTSATPAASSAEKPKPIASTAPPDDEETDATVLVRRGGFGSITCVSGMLVGQRWDIPPQGLVIGRDPKSDIVVNDTRVSSKHAYIQPKLDRIVVVDKDSTNGIFLNDVQNRVEGEAALSPGDLVMLSTTDVAHFIYRK